MCLEYNRRGLAVGEVGRTVCCVCCVCMCARWIEVGYAGLYTSLTVTEDEWRKFPLEQILHPPLAAALS